MPGQNSGSVGLGGTAASAGPRLRDVPAFVVLAVVMIVVGGLVAAVNSAAPFAHGSWLAAYLVLVGGFSQSVLCGGRCLLSAPRRKPPLEHVPVRERPPPRGSGSGRGGFPPWRGRLCRGRECGC